MLITITPIAEVHIYIVYPNKNITKYLIMEMMLRSWVSLRRLRLRKDRASRSRLVSRTITLILDYIISVMSTSSKV